MYRQFKTKYPNDSIENMNYFILKKPLSKFMFYHYLAMKGRRDEYRLLDKARAKQVKREGNYITKNEIMKMINSISNQNHQLVALIQFITGARAGDVLSLEKKRISQVTDIDGIGLKLNLSTKGDKDRIVFIPTQFCPVLNEYFAIRGNRPFFVSQSYDDYTRALSTNYTKYWRSIRDAAKRNGIDNFGTHDFRRNFIDEAYTIFKDIRIVKDLVGHSSLNLTLRYLKKKISKEEFVQSIKVMRG